MRWEHENGSCCVWIARSIESKMRRLSACKPMMKTTSGWQRTPLNGESLQAEVVQLAERSESNQIEELRIGALSPGVFETRFPLLAEGTYRIRVKDPVTGSYAEQEFVVTGASAEMRSSVRDETLQNVSPTSRKVPAACWKMPINWRTESHWLHCVRPNNTITHSGIHPCGLD